MTYVSNHYVPQWHQRRFIPRGQPQRELYYLDLRPDWFVDGRGTQRKRDALRHRPPKHCFAADDLYTARLGDNESRDIERKLFQEVDARGKRAVESFAGLDPTHPTAENVPRDPQQAMVDMLRYLSMQKLRTPKGLEWLAGQLKVLSHRELLAGMVHLQELHCAIWAECVWQLVSASQSATKLILSDHPVTVYNRACAPSNPRFCKGAHDPDIRLLGSHTLFPLDPERLLVLTNHAWAANPYQLATAPRPNPQRYRAAMFNYLAIQGGRQLTEQEVLEINYIVKQRAWRYVAAGQPEWLYPEQRLDKPDWRVFGKGHLLMPDPRALTPAGEWILAYDDGSFETLDSYGRPPGHPSFGLEARRGEQARRLADYRAEFGRMFGSQLRSWSFEERPPRSAVA
jgi:hypothetical protein